MKKINQTDPEDIKDVNIISLKNTSKEDETHKIISQQNPSEKIEIEDEPFLSQQPYIQNLMQKSEKYFGKTFTYFIKENICNITDLYLLISNLISMLFYYFGLSPCTNDDKCIFKYGKMFSRFLYTKKRE